MASENVESLKKNDWAHLDRTYVNSSILGVVQEVVIESAMDGGVRDACTCLERRDVLEVAAKDHRADRLERLGGRIRPSEGNDLF